MSLTVQSIIGCGPKELLFTWTSATQPPPPPPLLFWSYSAVQCASPILLCSFILNMPFPSFQCSCSPKLDCGRASSGWVLRSPSLSMASFCRLGWDCLASHWEAVILPGALGTEALKPKVTPKLCVVLWVDQNLSQWLKQVAFLWELSMSNKW